MWSILEDINLFNWI